MRSCCGLFAKSRCLQLLFYGSIHSPTKPPGEKSSRTRRSAGRLRGKQERASLLAAQDEAVRDPGAPYFCKTREALYSLAQNRAEIAGRCPGDRESLGSIWPFRSPPSKPRAPGSANVRLPLA